MSSSAGVGACELAFVDVESSVDKDDVNVLVVVFFFFCVLFFFFKQKTAYEI